MRRTLEKLAQERKRQEDSFRGKIEELRRLNREPTARLDSSDLKNLFLRLEKAADSHARPAESEKPGFFARLFGVRKPAPGADRVNRHVHRILADVCRGLEQTTARMNESTALCLELFDLNASLMDAKDKEWDALGSNHVGMIFKSMEWRIDKLAAAYDDVNILMKKFIRLKGKVESLLDALESGDRPDTGGVRDIAASLEDWRYAGFENRFRGSEDDVRRQQTAYLPYFRRGKPVLDLGCGRGEFLELLEADGIEAQGVDINEPLVEMCLEKGLRCRRADIFEDLAAREDDSLGGVFASQVVEHLSPPSLQKLIELCYSKLAPGGRIVLETVNPASVFALVHVFFLDFTHRVPLHPQTLKFLLESAGFDEVEIKYSVPLEQQQLEDIPGADEASTVLNRNIDKLNSLLFAASNYAAVGLK